MVAFPHALCAALVARRVCNGDEPPGPPHRPPDHAAAITARGELPLGLAYGRPPIFISHGTADEILDIDQSSRVFVPALRRQGYRVQFRQFDGPHTIPPEVAKEAFRWWLVDKM